MHILKLESVSVSQNKEIVIKCRKLAYNYLTYYPQAFSMQSFSIKTNKGLNSAKFEYLEQKIENGTTGCRNISEFDSCWYICGGFNAAMFKNVIIPNWKRVIVTKMH